MRDARYRRNVESLLFFEMRQILEGALNKGPVNGGSGEAFGSSPDDAEVATIMMESGLYLPGQLTTPLTVYSGAALQAYLAASGTPHPVTTVNQYLMQQAEWSTDGFKWATTFSLGVKNEYSSAVHQTGANLTQDNTDSSKYTGLLRLAIQAKNGAGLDVADLSPWGIDPLSHGLLRSADYTYYIIKIDSTGAYARKLKSNAESIRTWLTDYKAGTLALSDGDAVRFEAYLMSTLEVDTAVSQFDLLTATDLLSAYDGRSPIAHGWHFSRNWEDEAAIVTFRESPLATALDFYYETTLSKVTFVVTDALITAVFSVVQADAPLMPSAGRDYLWIPAAGQLCPLKAPDTATPGTPSGTAPIYAFYAAAGLEVLWYTHPTYTETETAPIVDDEPRICGEGTISESVEYGTSQTYTGGWHTDAGASANNPIYTQGGLKSILFDVQETGVSDYQASTSFSKFYVQENAESCGTFASMPDSGTTQGYQANRVSFDYEYRSETYYGHMDVARIAVIPVTGPDAVYLAQGWSQRTKDTYVKTLDLSSTNELYSKLRWKMKPEYGGAYTDFFNVGVMPTADTSDPWDCYGVGACTIWMNGSSSTTTIGEVEGAHCTATLSTSGGLVPLSNDWSAWQTFSDDSACKQHTMECIESFGGEQQYFDTPAAVIFDEGYDADVTPGLIKRWAGWV